MDRRSKGGRIGVKKRGMEAGRDIDAPQEKEEEEEDLIRDACRPTICSWVERKGAGAKKSPR